MGFLNKISKKIGDKIEESAVKHMTDEQREEYEKEKESKLSAEKSFEAIRATYSKEETKDLEGLLKRIGAIDDRALWIGGFLKLRTDTNAIFANLFSGHKNLRFLTYNNGVFYMIKFEKNEIYSYTQFDRSMVVKASFGKTFDVKLARVSMTLQISKNKKKAKELLSLLISK